MSLVPYVVANVIANDCAECCTGYDKWNSIDSKQASKHIGAYRGQDGWAESKSGSYEIIDIFEVRCSRMSHT